MLQKESYGAELDDAGPVRGKAAGGAAGQPELHLRGDAEQIILVPVAVVIPRSRAGTPTARGWTRRYKLAGPVSAMRQRRATVLTRHNLNLRMDTRPATARALSRLGPVRDKHGKQPDSLIFGP
ncbi:MAG: hypothetical protein K2W93_17200 [Burkholderiaceae bacterium]|nr:hypothetical protein [Burkholderiaceae bacterium]